MIAATPAHAAAMAAIHQAAFGRDAWDESSFTTLLAQPCAAGFIDERGGILLLRVAADEAEILTLGVAAQRQGIGRMLMNAAIAAARDAGAANMFLEVAADNAAALALYGRLGFHETGRRPRYYRNGADALTYCLKLNRLA